MTSRKQFCFRLLATLLALTFVGSAFNLNVSTAQTIQQRPMFIFVGAAPNPVGVGQDVNIVTWTSEMCMPADNDATAGAPGGRETWTGISITITKPDKTNETILLPPSDPVGGNYYKFIPDQTGNYSVIANFPGEWKNRTSALPYGSSGWQAFGPGSYYFKAAESEPATFTVVQEQLQWVSGVPLPTEYWSRPIHAYNRQWSTIAGNWITGLRDLPYITAPNSSHIMWTKPYFFGGIAGGASEQVDYYEGTSYEGKFSGVTIIQGVLIYNVNLGSSSTTSQRSIVARDLRTGELLWTINKTSVSGSTLYDYESRNQHGIHPYIWTSGNVVQTSFTAPTPGSVIVDPFSGQELFGYYNVPSGSEGVGPNGERLIYVLGGPTSPVTTAERATTNVTWIALWNFSRPLSMTGVTAAQLAYYNATGQLVGTDYDQWRPIGKTINGSTAYSWNITAPKGLRATSHNIAVLSDRIIAGSGWQQFGTAAPSGNFRLWALSTAASSRGQVLWDITIKPTVANETLQFAGTSAVSESDGVFLVRAKETRRWMGFDIKTGTQLWTSDQEPQWMMYSSEASFSDGKFFTCGYGGQVFAYDAKTGARLWTASADPEGLESAYGRSPLSMQAVVDGKVIVTSQEHSMTNPYYRTWKVYAFNAETGERMWDLNGAWSSAGFADGYMAAMNFFDGQVYCIGKGPSAVSIDTDNVANLGDGVMVSGMVKDISPGTNDYRISARFPNGLPAVADDSMTPWMEYVYMQKPKPTNVTGVEVTVSVIDPNNNYYEVGKATCDANGMFKLMFTPEVPGEYTVVANFDGSDSYWPSQAQTAVGIVEAKQQVTPQPAQPASIADVYLLPVAVAMIVAVALVGILLALMIRKRQ